MSEELETASDHKITAEEVAESLRLPYPLALLFTFLYAVIFVIGLIGNILTSITIARTPFLRSTTNLFLCNLALSDTLLLIFGGAPFDVLKLWNENVSPTYLGDPFCAVRTLLAETASCVSVITIVIITGERYMAICQAFAARSYYLDRRRLCFCIAAVWMSSLLPSAVIAYQFGVQTVPNDTSGSNSAHVDLKESENIAEFNLTMTEFNFTESLTTLHHCTTVRPQPYIYEIVFVLFFVAPMIIIAAAYAAIVRHIRVSLSRQSSGSDPTPLVSHTPHIRARYLVIKMLIVVVTVFFLTHLPWQLQRLIYNHSQPHIGNAENIRTDAESVRFDTESIRFVGILYNVAGLFQFGGAAANPIMYTVMSRRFRMAFRRLIGVGSRMQSSAANGVGNDFLLLQAGDAGADRRRSFSRSPLLF